MDWLTFTTQMVNAVTSLAWPALIISLLLLFRPHIEGLAQRIEILKLPGGTEAHFFRGEFDANLPAVKSMGERVRTLNAAQALALARTMEPHIQERRPELQALMKKLDPGSGRLTDGIVAKRKLLGWQPFDDRDAASLKQWTDALDVIEKT